MERLVPTCPVEPRRQVWCVHGPPHGTNLDMLKSRVHVGSRALRACIEHTQPLLTLHGHIHETGKFSHVRVCGVWCAFVCGVFVICSLKLRFV